MSEPDKPSVPTPRSDEERAAFFNELMRIERSQNPPPISGLAVAAFGFAIVSAGLALFFAVVSLVVGATAFVFGVFALPQIKHRDRRGLGFVLAALGVLAVGVVFVIIALNLV